MTDYEQFKRWLEINTNLSEKSIRDVVSRLKRATTFINLNLNLNKDETIFKLSQNLKFKDLNIDVRSQLKKAIKFYKQYRDDLSKEVNENH